MPVGDTEALTAAIGKLLSDSELRHGWEKLVASGWSEIFILNLFGKLWFVCTAIY